MKKLILLTALGLALSLPSFCQIQDNIDLDNMTVSMPDGLDYLYYAYYDIGIGQPANSICKNNFEITLDQLNTLTNTILPIPANVTHYIEALEFVYGINDPGNGDPSFDLYIRPIYLTLIQPPSGQNNPFNYYTYQIAQGVQFNYYTISTDGTSVPQAVPNQMAIDVNNYQQYLYIHHNTEDDDNMYNSEDQSDPTEVIYSIQELQEMFKKNNNSPLYLYIIGRPESEITNYINGEVDNDPLIRFDLMLVPSSLSQTLTTICNSVFEEMDKSVMTHESRFTTTARKERILGAFKKTFLQVPQMLQIPPNKFADLGSLCPPECPEGCSNPNSICKPYVGYYLVSPPK